MVRVYTFRRFAFRLVGRAKELLVLCSGKNVLHHGFYACRNGPVLGFLVGSGFEIHSSGLYLQHLRLQGLRF